MWRKGKSCVPFECKDENGTAIMETSIKFPQKINMIQQSHLWVYGWREYQYLEEISVLRIHWGIIHHSHDMDMNQVNGEEWLCKEKCECEWVWVWIVSVSVSSVCVCVCVDKQMLSSRKKRHSAICDNVDGPELHYAKN